MSTRAQLQIEGSAVLIYKHSDGYPEGVLPTLLPWRDIFWTERGHDAEYATARLLMAFAVAEYRDALEAVKSDPADLYARKTVEGRDCLGFGASTDLHGDIEYFYSIAQDGTVTVRHRGASRSIRPTTWPVVASYRIGERPAAKVSR